MPTPHDPIQPPESDPGAHELPEFARALRDLYTTPAAVPATLEGEILSKARWRLARPLSRILPWALPLSAAAAIAMAVWWPQSAERDSAGVSRHGLAKCPAASAETAPASLAAPAHGAPPLLPRSEDFDRSGRVDILDAYALACKVDRGERVASAWDLNHDGAVDRKDVDAIAMAAVRVR